MNYERLKKLASLLDAQHGEPNRHGFIIAPENEQQLQEHKNALIHRNTIFHYEPMSEERLGIFHVTREETVNDDQSSKVNYSHTRLEHMQYESLATPEIAPLLDEYMEYTKAAAHR